MDHLPTQGKIKAAVMLLRGGYSTTSGIGQRIQSQKLMSLSHNQISTLADGPVILFNY